MQKDHEVLRNLAGRLSEIAGLPVQKAKRALWTATTYEAGASLVLMDSCPGRLAGSDEMALQWQTRFCGLSSSPSGTSVPLGALSLPTMVVENASTCPRRCETGYGITSWRRSAPRPANRYRSNKYEDQLQTREPWWRSGRTGRATPRWTSVTGQANDICADPPHPTERGVQIHAGVWDRSPRCAPPSTSFGIWRTTQI